jgi:hypothetical protein
VIKEFVKIEQRMGEEFISGFCMTQTRRMTCLLDRPFGEGKF